MADDDETPRHRRLGSHWPDDQRALVGAPHRTTAPRGIPISQIVGDHTPVYEGPSLDEPMTRGQAKQLTDWIKRRLEDSSGDPDEIASITNEVAKLRERVADLARDVAPLNALRKWLWASSITAVLAIAGFLFSRGYSEGEARQRLEQMERFVDELRRDVRALEQRHSSLSPLTSPDAISAATEGRKS